MAKDKNIKTNAMRILEKNKIPFKVNYYDCAEFIDGIHIADMLGQSYDISFKTLVAVGKSKENFVFLTGKLISLSSNPFAISNPLNLSICSS